MSLFSVPKRYFPLIFALAGAFFWLLPSASFEAAEGKQRTTVKDLITFTWTLSPEDPFSKENAVGATPKEFKRGETFFLTITGKPKEGYHTYPVTKKTEKQSGGNTTLTYSGDAFQPLGPPVESEPEMFDEGPLFGLNLEHEKPFTLIQEMLVKPEANPGIGKLKVQINLQVCNESACVPGTYDLEIPITVAPGDAVALTPAIQEKMKRAQPQPEVVNAEPSTRIITREEKPTKKETSQLKTPSGTVNPAEELSFWEKVNRFFSFLPEPLLFIVVAAVAGGVSLFTPCVFPMIPITVSYFLKQAETSKDSALKTAAIYSGTIVVVLTVGGLLVMSTLKEISQHWATNFLLGALFIVFALSLLGMYDIAMPSWLVNLTSSKQSKGGILGTIFMALTFTIVSFTCVGPVYGGLAVGTAASQSVGHNVKLFFAALAYSVTFALPFFVLALFPSLLKMLPKSGGWMNTMKVVMGFLELAAAFVFFRGAEIGMTQAQPKFLTFDLVLGIYVALSFTCGLYLLNVFRLPHDYEAMSMLSVPRLLFAIAFLALGLYLMPALFKQPNGRAQRPNGSIYAWIESFLLVDSTQPTNEPSPNSQASGSTSDELTYLANLKDGLKKAKTEDKRVLIDFTGVLCKNCRLNENDVFSLPDVRALMTQYVLVQLYTDTVPGYLKNATSAEQNAQLEREQFGGEELPKYVIVEPVDDSFKKLETYSEAKINDVVGFKKFLKRYASAK